MGKEAESRGNKAEDRGQTTEGKEDCGLRRGMGKDSPSARPVDELRSSRSGQAGRRQRTVLLIRELGN